MSLVKKLFVIAIALTVFCVFAPKTNAVMTNAELQQQINALTQQLQQLQQQLVVLQGGGTINEGIITGTGCTNVSFNRTLSQGMSGEDVKCLQTILNSSADTQIATMGVGSPGNETTYFGSLTKTAVVKFQKKHAAEILTPSGLVNGTGIVAKATQSKIIKILGK